MSGVDWRALVDRELFEQFEASGELPPARDLLTTRVPQLCQTCEGSGGVCGCSPFPHLKASHVRDCGTWAPCPDCPTVEQLLAIGAAVWTAKRYPNTVEEHMPDCVQPIDGGAWYFYAETLLHALRGVTP